MTLRGDLQALAGLRRDGLLTDSEYEEAKRTILPAEPVPAPRSQASRSSSSEREEVVDRPELAPRPSVVTAVVASLWTLMPAAAVFAFAATAWRAGTIYRVPVPVYQPWDFVPMVGAIAVVVFAFFLRSTTDAADRRRVSNSAERVWIALGGAVGACLLAVYCGGQASAMLSWAGQTQDPSTFNITDAQLTDIAVAVGWLGAAYLTQAILVGIAGLAFLVAIRRRSF